MMNLTKICANACIFAAMLLTGSLASADIIVTPGVDNSGTDNVISNGCDANITGPAFTVQGCLNSDRDFYVNFTSDENLVISGGQSSLVAQDGLFSLLSVSLAAQDWTFNKLLLNIDANQDGFVTFTGVPGGVSSQFALSNTGENKFIITGEDFSTVSFQTTVGVNSVDLVADVKQVRIGGEEGPPDPDTPVPVPGTLLLFGLGLAALVRTSRQQS